MCALALCDVRCTYSGYTSVVIMVKALTSFVLGQCMVERQVSCINEGDCRLQLESGSSGRIFITVATADRSNQRKTVITDSVF